MVGFGSSLRISRRRGWESAYLDYESLKLLLAHIEAVYEETRHLANQTDYSATAGAGDGAGAGGGGGTGGFGLSLNSVLQGQVRGGGGEDRHVSALGHVNFHFMETDDDVENHAHPQPHGAVGDMRSGRGRGGRELEGADDDKKHQRQDQQQPQQETPGDYRDELFLESDSDYAYMSVGDDASSDVDDDDDSAGHRHLEAGNRNDRDGMGRGVGGGGYEYNNSDDEDAGAMVGPAVGADVSRDFGQSEVEPQRLTVDEQLQEDDTGGIWRQKQMQDQHFQYGSAGADSRNFGGGGGAAAEDPEEAVAGLEDAHDEDEAYLTDTSGHGQVDSAQESRYVYEPFSQIQSESSTLLRHSSAKDVVAESSFFSLFSRRKKEEDVGREHENKVQQQQKTPDRGSAGAFTNFGRSVVVGGGPDASGGENKRPMMMSHQQFQQQERVIPIIGEQSTTNGEASPRKRRVRMKRTKRRKRSRRKRRVPIHILIAHSKARAITERFLGLLRAEVEKVTLFAHARMGELADTVGSLRFPSYDDGRNGNKGEYPLSDGGIHPSASSSSDEFGRTMSWSDSSGEGRDDERMKMRLEQKLDSSGRSRGTRRSVAAVAASVTAASKQRSGLRRKSDYQVTSHQGAPGHPTLTSDQDLALKQIQHAEQLRIDRPTFQRVSVWVEVVLASCYGILQTIHIDISFLFIVMDLFRRRNMCWMTTFFFSLPSMRPMRSQQSALS